MKRAWHAALIGALVAAPAMAAPRSHASQPSDAAPIFRSVVECRAIVQDAARLACYDGKVAAMEAAAKAGDVVIADKTQIRESKKALFGFGSIRIPFFDSSSAEETTKIEAKVVGVREIGYGKIEVTLDNGMRWRQTDGDAILTKAGQPVVIRSAALGSYFMKVGNQSTVRAIRVE